MTRRDRAPSTDIRGFTVVLAFIAVAIIAILWKGPWFVDEHGTGSQYQIDRAQQVIITQLRDAIKAYDVDAMSLASNPDPALQKATSAQQADVKSTFCLKYSTLTIVPLDILKAHTRICG